MFKFAGTVAAQYIVLSILQARFSYKDRACGIDGGFAQ